MRGIVSPGGIAQPGDGPLDPGRVRTNFVLFRVERDRRAFLEAVAARGVLMVGYPHGQVRAVTHYGDRPGPTSRPTMAAVGRRARARRRGRPGTSRSRRRRARSEGV